jgi:hypothetical protein
MHRVFRIVRHLRVYAPAAAIPMSLALGCSSNAVHQDSVPATAPSKDQLTAPRIPTAGAAASMGNSTADCIVDHLSGQPFELHRKLATKDDDHIFHNFGCNTRCMLGWCWMPIARAYAFAFYVDDKAVRWGHDSATKRSIENNTSSPSPPLPSVRDMLDTKQAHPNAFEVSVVLKMAREIAGEHLAHGFRNSIIARLPNNKTPVDKTAALATGKAAAGIQPGAPVETKASVGTQREGEPALAQIGRFTSAFNGTIFKTGEEITFVWTSSGAMQTYFKGELIAGGSTSRDATITNAAVIRALFDVYVGEKDAVSSTAVNTIRANWQAAITSPAVVSDAPPTVQLVASAVTGSAVERREEEDVVDVIKGALEKMKQKWKELSDTNNTPNKPVATKTRTVRVVDRAVDADALSAIVKAEHSSRTY